MLVTAGSWNLGDTLGITGLLLTVVVAAVVYRRQRRTKYIEWIVFIDRPLVASDVRELGAPEPGQELRDPQFVMLTIYNLSREAIREEDWHAPITISFPRGTVVSVSTSTNSEDFYADAYIHDTHTVILRPLLLNYFDKVTLRAIVDGSTDGLGLHTRIAGQTQLARRGVLRGGPGDEPSRVQRLWDRVPESARAVLQVVLLVVWLLDLGAWLFSQFD
jgi:hypothetical protein